MDKELKNILKMAIGTLAVIIAIAWIGSDVKTYMGLIVGGVVSIINFLLSYRDAASIVRGGDVKRIKISGYILRYMILILSLTVMINISQKSFFGAIAGVLLIRVVIYFREIYKVLKTFINKNKF